jgi:hypothetical protein
LSVSRTTTGRATSAVELNSPGARTRGRRTSKHAKGKRLRRGSHVFPASAKHSQGDRRLRRRGRWPPLRSCGSPARTSPPAAAPVGERDPWAINATARSLPRPASHPVQANALPGSFLRPHSRSPRAAEPPAPRAPCHRRPRARGPRPSCHIGGRSARARRARFGGCGSPRSGSKCVLSC